MNLVAGCRIKPKLNPEPLMEKARDRLRCFGAQPALVNSICYLLRPAGLRHFAGQSGKISASVSLRKLFA
jgi:hypothetical protein